MVSYVSSYTLAPKMVYILKSSHRFTTLYNYDHQLTPNLLTPNLSHRWFYLTLQTFSSYFLRENIFIWMEMDYFCIASTHLDFCALVAFDATVYM